MSVKVMAMVWESGLPKNMKMTLLAYADHANDDGESIYPGEDWMADKTSDSEGNVRRVTKLLREDGVLVQTKKGHRGQRAEFRIDLERLAAHIARHSEERKARASVEKGAQPEPVRRASVSGKARGDATPNVSHPSVDPSAELAAKPPRPRDYLWEAFVAVHGEPEDGTERGKFNRAKKLLEQAEVTPDEYPLLVAAYTAKYGGLQPAAMTVATRIGEMRHFVKRGPITVPDLETLARQRRVAEAQDEYDRQEAIG